MNAAPDQPDEHHPQTHRLRPPGVAERPQPRRRVRGIGTNAARATTPSIPRRPQTSVRNSTNARATPIGKAIASVARTSRAVWNARPSGRTTSPARTVGTISPAPEPDDSSGFVASRTVASERPAHHRDQREDHRRRPDQPPHDRSPAARINAAVAS